jgi:hypothetical protein
MKTPNHQHQHIARPNRPAYYLGRPGSVWTEALSRCQPTRQR